MSNEKESRIEMKITGLVQGVFFRQGVKQEAERLRLVGLVRNEPDGAVRVVAEGPEEDLQKLAEWCRKGTELARVERVEIDRKKPGGLFKTFEVN